LTSKVLDEGYNLPKIDIGVIMAGDSTARQTVQRAGRVLRRKSKTSHIYQIYCKNTIEEQYAHRRSILFKNLCTNYYQYSNNIEEAN
jgi:superfamily II DNA or RNA helicase